MSEQPLQQAEDTESVASVFARTDVEHMIAFLGDLLMSDEPLATKRQRAFEWIADTVKSDIWVWLQSQFGDGHSIPVSGTERRHSVPATG